MDLNSLPIKFQMPGNSYRGKLLPLDEQEIITRNRMRAHVEMLAGEIGERNVQRWDTLNKAAEYIQSVWENQHLKVHRQEFTVLTKPVCNLEVEIKGQTDELIIVGAHYDSVTGSPGANDNGTGIAAILEMAQMLKQSTPAKTIRFVAFVNEEPPYFQTANMGSYHYSRRCKDRGERISAMMSVETIGYYSSEPGSQQYPHPLNLFYPSQGNFIGFVSNMDSVDLLQRCIASFRSHTQFASEGIAGPEHLQGIDWSDQWAFWKDGYPAIMVTDTAVYRYPEYHTQFDQPDRVHYDACARVTAGLSRVVRDLAKL
jgi:Zn-dependent M28 family amino/carboxypeptidase